MTNLAGKRYELLALLVGLSLFLSTLEYMIPKPMPFMKIGLVNIVIIISLTILTSREFFLLVILKIITQGLVHGTLFSYIILFSIVGTIGSSLIMFVLYKSFHSKNISLIGISLAGAVTSNILQLILSRYLIFGSSIIYMVPIVLLWGFLAGISIGIIATIFKKRSKWLARFSNNLKSNNSSIKSINAVKHIKSTNRKNLLSFIPFYMKIVVSIIFISLIVFVNNYYIQVSIITLLFILNILSGKRIKPLFYISTAALILFFYLLKPTGLVIFQYKFIKITQIALENGIDRILMLFSMILSSQFIITKEFRIKGEFGMMIMKSIETFYLLSNLKGLINKKSVFEDLDSVLLGLYNPTEDNQIQK